MPRRFIAGPMPRQHHAFGLSFNHLHLNRHVLPHTTILPIHTLHIRSVIHWVVMLIHHIHTLNLRLVVHQMIMLLHHIHTFHLYHMVTHHIHISSPTGGSSSCPVAQPYTYPPPPAYSYPPP
jgi:hypothetical protein